MEFGRARRLDATAFVLPGTGRIEDYVAALSGAAPDFAAWDGRIAVVEPAADHVDPGHGGPDRV